MKLLAHLVVRLHSNKQQHILFIWLDMVYNNNGVISVGVEVNPDIFNTASPDWKERIVNIGVLYKVTMADIIIKVSDHDEENNSSKHEQQTIFNKNYQLFGSEEDENIDGNESNKIYISRSSRPVCRRKRSDESSQSYVAELSIHELEDNEQEQDPFPVPGIKSKLLKPCSYYRQKCLIEGNPMDCCWANYSALQKSAAQKVVHKTLVEQQKMMEGDGLEIKPKGPNLPVFNFDDGNNQTSSKNNTALLPSKKRPSRLEPLGIKSN